MFDTYVTVAGNLTDDPVMRRTTEGTPVTNFRIASNSRRFDRNAEEWVDGDSLYLKVTCWRTLAERVHGVLCKGDPVVVYGRVFTKPYEAEGQSRQNYEMEAAALGPNMARVEASIRRDSGVRTWVIAESEPSQDADGHGPAAEAPLDITDSVISPSEGESESQEEVLVSAHG